MKWALIIFLVHGPSGSVSTETLEFESKQLCNNAVSTFRYPTSGAFKIITTCVQTRE